MAGGVAGDETDALLQWGLVRKKDPMPALVHGADDAGRVQSRLLEDLYERMYLIRRTEETLLDLFSQGKLAGTTHTCIGQEAIPVAVGANLEPDDIVFGTHRGHGHFLGYGGPVNELLAEVMGRASQLCGGRGGSQHLHYRNFYSNGILGGTVGNATGAALAESLKGSRSVTVAFLGDGTLGEGLLYESLNFAALRSLPILYVLEDNQYAQSTPAKLGVSGSMPDRARAFGMAADEVETNDAVALHDLFGRRLSWVREQRRPFFQVVHTYRLAPHSKGDDTRDPEEIELWRKRDPVALMRGRLDPQTVDSIETRVEQALRDALADAESTPYPTGTGPSDTGMVDLDVPWAARPITYVESINAGLRRLLGENPHAFFMGEDVLSPYGGAFKAAKGLSTQFPDHVITTPVSEAGIVAWGTGAALRGLSPVVELMFGDFLGLATDQVLNHASKYRWIYNETVDVPLVIRTPMGGRRGYGATHSQSIESMYMGIPGLTVVAPSTLLDPGELLRRSSMLVRGPVLFIENKLLYAKRLEVPVEGRVGDAYVRALSRAPFPSVQVSLTNFAPADACLFTYGGSVPIALEAAQRLLLEDELVCDVVIVHALAPLPLGELLQGAGSGGVVATLEEGPIRNGWGASVVAAVAEHDRAARRFVRIGGPDMPLPSSKPLEDLVLPSMEGVVDAIRRTVGG
jgi:2-oxoisovalerate dehydrogenase E1 component